MLYGITMFATDYAIRPDELARLLEERGFESLWLPEHTHIPAGRPAPWQDSTLRTSTSSRIRRHTLPSSAWPRTSSCES